MCVSLGATFKTYELRPDVGCGACAVEICCSRFFAQVGWEGGENLYLRSGCAPDLGLMAFELVTMRRSCPRANGAHSARSSGERRHGRPAEAHGAQEEVRPTSRSCRCQGTGGRGCEVGRHLADSSGVWRGAGQGQGQRDELRGRRVFGG